MGYVDSASHFCCESDMGEYLANLRWAAATNTARYPLSALKDTPLDPDSNFHAGIVSSKMDASITARFPPTSTVVLLH